MTELSIDQQLIDAARAHNLQLVNDLIKKGAKVNHVRYTDSNGWYSGNTHTALYSAVHSDFKDNQKNYVDVIQLLLNNGADANFKAIRGGWNHSTSYPLFSGVAYKLGKFKTQEQKIRFITIFAKKGININQGQSHSRSKNWRGYRTHTCFIFQMMNVCGIGSRLEQCAKLYQKVNISQIQRQKQKQLQQEFQKQFPQYKKQQKQNQIKNNDDQQQEQEQEQEQEQSEQKQKKQPQVQFIKAIIQNGANPNSSNGASYWQNYKNDYYDENGDYQKFSKFDEKRSNTYQTVLHRAIMNDLPEFVQYLLKKGAKIQQKCKFTIEVPLYPKQWSEGIKERRKKQVQKQLKQNENKKYEYQQQLKIQESQQQKQSIKNNIQYCQLSIFKAKRFSIQNECPQGINQDKQITCLQLAQLLKISQKTIQILKKWVENKTK